MTVSYSSGLFHVYKPFAAAAHDLPPPPVNYEKVAVAIISQDFDQFKVMVARTKPCLDIKTLDIQTYSSSTGMWEESKIPCHPDLRLTGEPGLVSSKVTVYWPNDSNLAAYDTNNKRNILIRGPNHNTQDYTASLLCCYGVSPQGSVCCATYVLSSPKFSGAQTIRVWVLDEASLDYDNNDYDNNDDDADYHAYDDDDYDDFNYDNNDGNDEENDEIEDEEDDDNEDEENDEKHWKLMYPVNLKSMWVRHSSMLEPMFGRARKNFTFVSFAHGRRDCIYVELERFLFLYNLDTRELDRISPGCYYESRDVPSGFCTPTKHDMLAFDVSNKRKVPLTLPELGMWPVSSPVLHLR